MSSSQYSAGGSRPYPLGLAKGLTLDPHIRYAMAQCAEALKLQGAPDMSEAEDSDPKWERYDYKLVEVCMLGFGQLDYMDNIPRADPMGFLFAKIDEDHSGNALALL